MTSDIDLRLLALIPREPGVAPFVDLADDLGVTPTDLGGEIRGIMDRIHRNYGVVVEKRRVPQDQRFDDCPQLAFKQKNRQYAGLSVTAASWDKAKVAAGRYLRDHGESE